MLKIFSITLGIAPCPTTIFTMGILLWSSSTVPELLLMSGQGASMDADTLKRMDELMKGYHDLVEFGRREIYKLEN